jgi:translation initiation factor IF-1
MSTSYHPQTSAWKIILDAWHLTNLRNGVPGFQWLPMAEWWYNTSFHTALKMTPFQAFYGFPPPQVAEMFLIDDNTETAAEMLQNSQVANQIIKRNLQEAQNRMVHFANRNRSDRELLVGDMVYLKVQPYRHSSLSIHHCIKLHSKFYGPFRVLAKVGQTDKAW